MYTNMIMACCIQKVILLIKKSWQLEVLIMIDGVGELMISVIC